VFTRVKLLDYKLYDDDDVDGDDYCEVWIRSAGCGGRPKRNTGVSVVFEGVRRGRGVVAGELESAEVLVSRLVLVDIDRRLAVVVARRVRFRPVRWTCDQAPTHARTPCYAPTAAAAAA